MRVARVGALLLLLPPASVCAQLDGGAYWEQAGLREHGGMRLVSGATVSTARGAVAAAAIAGSAAVQLTDVMLGLHAGARHDRHGMTSAGATVSTRLNAGGNQLELRAGAAAAPDEHAGASVTSLGATFSRAGLSFSIRSSILPPVAAQARDSIVVERATTYRLGYIDSARPRRMYTDAAIGYRGELARLAFDAVAGYRIGSDPEQPYWARLGATWRITNALALGGSYGREPGTPWLQAKARSAATIFVRIDPPVRGVRVRPPRSTAPVQPLRITTHGATTFTIDAPNAHTVEIAGNFTDWTALALVRAENGSWSVSVPLSPGVYQIALRIDGGRWRAPPGLASVPDEFGGESGVFEVR